MKLTFWCLLLLRLAITAEGAQPGFVGDIDGNDCILHAHLYNFLLSHGIEAGFSGSVVHDVMVPTSQAAEARRLIREDAPKRHYDIWFAEDDQIHARGKPVERLRHRIPYEDLLRRIDYSSRTAVGRLLRRKEVVDTVVKYPYVDSLEIEERQYLATPTSLQKGYRVRIRLHSVSGPKGASYSFADYYIKDNGQDVWP